MTWSPLFPAALLLLCAYVHVSSAATCASSPTLKTQADFDSFTCTGVGNTVTLQPNAGLVLNWTFPTVTRLANLRITVNDTNTKLSVYFPALTTVSGWVGSGTTYGGRVQMVSIPKLESVQSYIDVLANVGSFIDNITIGGESTNGLVVQVAPFPCPCL